MYATDFLRTGVVPRCPWRCPLLSLALSPVVHKKVIYNIGTEILLATSPMHNSALVAQFSDVIFFSGILSTRRIFLARSQACRTSILMSFCKNTAQDSWHHFKHMLKRSRFSNFSKEKIREFLIFQLFP